MMPVIVGLSLSVPVALLSSRLVQAGLRAGLFSTPEQNIPPKVLDRANELAMAAPIYGTSPLRELRDNAELREAHLRTLADQPRTRGQIDADLAIARAKIEDAGCFDDAVSYLGTRETFAVLNSRIALEMLARLPDNSPVAD
jgi:membrane glycosyltransferase